MTQKSAPHLLYLDLDNKNFPSVEAACSSQGYPLECILDSQELPNIGFNSYDLIIMHIDHFNETHQEIMTPILFLIEPGDEQKLIQGLTDNRDFLSKDASGSYIQLLPIKIKQLLNRNKNTRISDKTEKDIRLIQLASVVEQAKMTVVITNLKGNIIYVNPYFELSSGYTRNEALGKNSRILKSGKQSKEVYKDLWQTIKTGKTWTGTFVNKRKNGLLYHEEAVIFPIQDGNGQIINYAAVKHNIDDRIKTAATMKKQKDFLDELVNGMSEGLGIVDANEYLLI